jgi:hypothetical protein
LVRAGSITSGFNLDHGVAPAQHSASFAGIKGRARIWPEAERTLAFAHGFRGTAWATTGQRRPNGKLPIFINLSNGLTHKIARIKAQVKLRAKVVDSSVTHWQRLGGDPARGNDDVGAS